MDNEVMTKEMEESLGMIPQMVIELKSKEMLTEFENGQWVSCLLCMSFHHSLVYQQ